MVNSYNLPTPHLTSLSEQVVIPSAHYHIPISSLEGLQGNGVHSTKLDESTARWHLKSPRSLSGRSLNLTLVTKWSRSWSWITYSNPLCSMSISPPILRYSYPWSKPCVWSKVKVTFDLKIHGQGHSQGQTYWSHLRPRVQSIYLLFVWWQSDHFWLRYSKFHIWPWKFKVKVMAKVKPDGHIWDLKFNQYVCFSFGGNRTIFGWDIANSIFDTGKAWHRTDCRLITWTMLTTFYDEQMASLHHSQLIS